MVKYLRFVPALVWMAVIFYFSGQSTGSVPVAGFERFLLFKAFHIIEYAVLSILLMFAVRRPWPSIIYSYIFAISDEYHQSFTPTRGPKVSDTLIDLFGIILGVVVISFLKHYPLVGKLFTPIHAQAKTKKKT